MRLIHPSDATLLARAAELEGCWVAQASAGGEVGAIRFGGDTMSGTTEGGDIGGTARMEFRREKEEEAPK